jgi:hypothetical protein
MEKSFEKFCARVKREREGLPSRSKYSESIVSECLLWASERPIEEVAEGLGVSDQSIKRWKKDRLKVGIAKVATTDVGLPAVLNVTRISVAREVAEGRVLARCVRGPLTIEFLDESALVRVLAGALS